MEDKSAKKGKGLKPRAMKRVNLGELLRAPDFSFNGEQFEKQTVQVYSPGDRPLFTARIIALGQLFSDAGKDSVQAYEVYSPQQMTWARNEKTGEEYNLFARATASGSVRFYYDPEREFHALVVMIGGQPRVCCNNLRKRV